MEKKNLMFHKGCPLTNKEKLWLVLHAEMCSQMIPNWTNLSSTIANKVNYVKVNINYGQGGATYYNFPDCENCTMNELIGWSGWSGYSGVPGRKPNVLDKFKAWVRYLRRVF